MDEPKAWMDCPPEKTTCQLESFLPGIFFDFENSNDSRRAWIPTTSAGSGHLTENVSYFLGPSLSRTQDNCPAARFSRGPSRKLLQSPISSDDP